ncbi:cytidylyltransferase family protein [Botryobacter ruber]|uniref:hypothetical protein n=1 Tax=Botryobacter ruber TaxID=2171629 RepID=UPI000E0C4E18|nr:hypothetical protein [Botryobacter ruber]
MATHLLLLIVPLVVSNVLHMVVVKKNWLQVLAQPVSGQLFGGHKTWRGFLLLPVLNGAVLVLVVAVTKAIPADTAFWLGAALGLAYMLAELPNSFLKRSRGIAPGESADRNKLLFRLLDKTDSAFGVCLLYYFLRDIALFEVVVLFLLSSGTHIFFSLLLVSLHLKKSF